MPDRETDRSEAVAALADALYSAGVSVPRHRASVEWYTETAERILARPTLAARILAALGPEREEAGLRAALGRLIDKYEGIGTATGHSVAWDLRAALAPVAGLRWETVGTDAVRCLDCGAVYAVASGYQRGHVCPPVFRAAPVAGLDVERVRRTLDAILNRERIGALARIVVTKPEFYVTERRKVIDALTDAYIHESVARSESPDSEPKGTTDD